MTKNRTFLKLIKISSNLIRRIVVGILITILVACFFILIIEFKHDIFIQALGAAIVFSALWLVLKIDSWLFEAVNNKQQDK